MARKNAEGTSKRAYWAEQIAKATTQYSQFQLSGDRVVDRYRIEKANAQVGSLQDRYNILYSSTETVRPSLYAQTPKVEVTKRHIDRKQPVVQQAVELLESTVTYAVEEVDFDGVIENVIEDYTLPGMGNAWVRYEPSFKDQKDSTGAVVNDDKGNAAQVVDYEAVAFDYVNWKDQLYGPCRIWAELPWGARRVYFGKKAATKRFGAEKANKLQYIDNATKSQDRAPVVEDKQAVIWEIWDKENREVIWFSDSYPDDVLDTKSDPLKLKNFFPFPKPLRAISNTRTFVARPFYSQYQAQAEELDNLTQRIRFLTEALNVRGVYDGSQDKLAHLLNKAGGNKLIAIENWHQFIGEKGINGAIQWVPIDIIVQVLMELYKARDIVKNEIYEITGFSDIVRGQSKASETLGAQQIKTDWASARLRVMQKEVQRFIRDVMRIMGEIISEQFSIESFALYSGFEVPELPPEYQQQVQAAMAAQQPPPPDPRQVAVQQFQAAVQLLKTERSRCANIGIETDSTILPDEEKERKDRLEFLGQVGAFMQQAAPTAQAYPQMAGLLGAMMMFTVRTFRASRPIEQEFERFQQAMITNPPQPQNKDGGAAARAQSAVQIAQMKEQGNTTKQDKELQFKTGQAEADRQLEREKLQAQAATDQVQLQIKQAELRIKETELVIKQAELGLKQQQGALQADDQAHRHALEADDQAHGQALDVDTANRADRALDDAAQQADADREAAQDNPQEGSE